MTHERESGPGTDGITELGSDKTRTASIILHCCPAGDSCRTSSRLAGGGCSSSNQQKDIIEQEPESELTDVDDEAIILDWDFNSTIRISCQPGRDIVLSAGRCVAAQVGSGSAKQGQRPHTAKLESGGSLATRSLTLTQSAREVSKEEVSTDLVGGMIVEVERPGAVMTKGESPAENIAEDSEVAQNDQQEARLEEKKDRRMSSESVLTTASSVSIKKKNTRFSKVEIRTYNQILCDHPGTVAGPPVGIGWKYDPDTTMVYNVEVYEEFPHRRCQYRSIRDMRLSRKERENILTRLGYQKAEIASCVRSLNKVKQQRRTTIGNLRYEGMEEKAEVIKSQLTLFFNPHRRRQRAAEEKRLFEGLDRRKIDVSKVLGTKSRSEKMMNARCS